MALLLSSLLLLSAVSAMPLNTQPSATDAPVMPQFTFTPIPVNEQPSKAPSVDVRSSDGILTQSETSSVNPYLQTGGSEGVTFIEQPQPVPVVMNDASIAVQPVIEASTTLPEQVTATQIAETVSASLPQNDAAIAVQPIAESSTILPAEPTATEIAVESSSIVLQNDAAVVDTLATESTTPQTMTASERSAEPVVFLDEHAQVQAQQILNSENTETVTDATTPETDTFEPVTPSSEALAQNDATFETVAPTEAAQETTTSDNVVSEDGATSTVMPGDQPQLDFVDETSVQGTAYQYLNMADSMADHLILNISMPSAPSELLTRLQQSTNKMNYGEKLDVALQLTALAHTLMTSVDTQLDVLKQ